MGGGVELNINRPSQYLAWANCLFTTTSLGKMSCYFTKEAELRSVSCWMHLVSVKPKACLQLCPCLDPFITQMIFCGVQCLFLHPAVKLGCQVCTAQWVGPSTTVCWPKHLSVVVLVFHLLSRCVRQLHSSGSWSCDEVHWECSINKIKPALKLAWWKWVCILLVLYWRNM